MADAATLAHLEDPAHATESGDAAMKHAVTVAERTAMLGVRESLGVQMLIAVLNVGVGNAGEAPSDDTSSTVAETITEAMAPLSAISSDGDVFRIAITAAPGGNNHSSVGLIRHCRP